MVCSTFSTSGWSVVRRTWLTKGGTSKKRRHRISTKFRLGIIRGVHELFKLPWYLRALIWIRTHYLSVRAVQAHTRLRQHDLWDFSYHKISHSGFISLSGGISVAVERMYVNRVTSAAWELCGSSGVCHTLRRCGHRSSG
jgi:hypothetical protein